MSGKASNLAILHDNGIKVPRGFAVAASHYARHVKPEFERIVANIRDAPVVLEIFDQICLDSELTDALDERLEKLQGVEHFAARSSAKIFHNGSYVGEDGAKVSLAGQFESFLNVSRDEVCSALKRCWASLFNHRSVHRFHAGQEYVVRSEMTVLVQEMIEAKACAVVMTCDPQGDGAFGAIESAWGPCEAIVAGIVNPDEIIFDRSTGRILSSNISRKTTGVRYLPYGTFHENCIRVEINEPIQLLPALNERNIGELVYVSSKIERIFGHPQDIEAVFDGDDILTVTQARNITTLPTSFAPLTVNR